MCPLQCSIWWEFRELQVQEFIYSYSARACASVQSRVHTCWESITAMEGPYEVIFSCSCCGEVWVSTRGRVARISMAQVR